MWLYRERKFGLLGRFIFHLTCLEINNLQSENKRLGMLDFDFSIYGTTLRSRTTSEKIFEIRYSRDCSCIPSSTVWKCELGSTWRFSIIHAVHRGRCRPLRCSCSFYPFLVSLCSTRKKNLEKCLNHRSKTIFHSNRVDFFVSFSLTVFPRIYRIFTRRPFSQGFWKKRVDSLWELSKEFSCLKSLALVIWKFNLAAGFLVQKCMFSFQIIGVHFANFLGIKWRWNADFRAKKVHGNIST